MQDGEEKQEQGVKGTQTLMRALDIMDEVIDGPIRAADLARKLGMSKTTAHRLVQALKSRDYLAVTRNGFALGPKLLQLGVLATEQIDYVRVARPFMELLSEKTGFCVFVGKREGDWSRHLDRVTGNQRLRVATAPGDRRPVAETGLGKALLLDEDEATWERLYVEAKGGEASRRRSTPILQKCASIRRAAKCCMTVNWAMACGRSRCRCAMPRGRSASPSRSRARPII